MNSGKPMRIAMIAIGSTGDVQPIMALGAGLQRKKNHEVVLVTHDDFEHKAHDLGLEFRPLGVTSVRDLVMSPRGQQFVSSGANPLRNFLNLVSLARKHFRDMLSRG